MYDATVYYEEKAKDHISLKKWNLDERRFCIMYNTSCRKHHDSNSSKIHLPRLHYISKKPPNHFSNSPADKKKSLKSRLSQIC